LDWFIDPTLPNLVQHVEVRWMVDGNPVGGPVQVDPRLGHVQFANELQPGQQVVAQVVYVTTDGRLGPVRQDSELAPAVPPAPTVAPQVTVDSFGFGWLRLDVPAPTSVPSHPDGVGLQRVRAELFIDGAGTPAVSTIVRSFVNEPTSTRLEVDGLPVGDHRFQVRYVYDYETGALSGPKGPDTAVSLGGGFSMWYSGRNAPGTPYVPEVGAAIPGVSYVDFAVNPVPGAVRYNWRWKRSDGGNTGNADYQTTHTHWIAQNEEYELWVVAYDSRNRQIVSNVIRHKGGNRGSIEPWYGRWDGSLWRDQSGGPVVPDGFTTTRMRWEFDPLWAAGTLTSSTRQVYFVAGGAEGFPVPAGLLLPLRHDFDPWTVGPGGSGLVLHGTGWGTSSSSQYRIQGNVQVWAERQHPPVNNGAW
jgi:hypothetical protein